MAEKKKTTRAQKAAADGNKVGSESAKSSKSSKKTSSPAKKNNTPPVRTEYDDDIPSNLISAFVFLVLFILFALVAINPEGFLLNIIKSVILGLIGKVGLYFSIPVFFFLAIIQGFKRRNPVRARTVYMLSLVILCGCVYHLSVPYQTYAGFGDTIIGLYSGGVSGASGGVICGLLTILLRWLCGKVLSYIILGVSILVCLLGSMKITIPSLIRAFINRPRYDDGESEEEGDYPEPAEVIVNHIAQKRIDHKQRTRQKQIAAAEEEIQIPPKASASYALHEAQAQIEKNAVVVSSPNSNDLFSQIEGDVTAPVSAAGKDSPSKNTHTSVVSEPVNKGNKERINTMPVFQPNDPVIDAAPAEDEIPIANSVSPMPGNNASEKVTAKQARDSAQEVAAEIEQAQKIITPQYSFPPLNLLNPPMRSTANGTDEMRENSRRLSETLDSFHIDAHIINVTRGPSVTRYEVELDKGVRLNKLTSSADDIALNLGASGVRIAAIPGKISVVGIEIPNKNVTMVSLREVIDSPEFEKSKSISSFAVGKDIGGSCIIGNIAKMPHMLIAGTTGSGKSVCMNSIILSLLYKAGPEDVKLIMVDPKMVELANYNGIPHLMIPVVTDPKKAAGALQWAVTEMMRRYKTMSDVGVRDLESYNSIAVADGGEKIPQLIVIIDELADLMLVAAKEVEDSICRVAQMGRAAGVHLVIATQRPSADVITGLMKANIPSRIAFSVASAMESRIILDTQGAEKLVGKGDMLFAPIGCGKPLRVQGCFVTDSEVEAVTAYVKEHYTADYDQQVLEDIEKKALQTGKKAAAPSADPAPTSEELDGDELLPDAVDVVLETGQASVSMLQRRLKLGYARAARIVDEMEEKGIVGPFQGSKPRSILITKEQWSAMRSGSSDIPEENAATTASADDSVEAPF